jgi:hypothetical protein
LIDAVREKFDVAWYYVSLGTPTNLPPELFAEQREKMRKDLEKAAVEIRDGLRMGFASLINHLVERLQPGDDGQKKMLFASAITNILEFIDQLQSRDLTNDDQLRALAAKAKTVLEGANMKDLKKKMSTRNMIASKMADVQKAAAKMITTVKTRKFDVEA